MKKKETPYQYWRRHAIITGIIAILWAIHMWYSFARGSVCIAKHGLCREVVHRSVETAKFYSVWGSYVFLGLLVAAYLSACLYGMRIHRKK